MYRILAVAAAAFAAAAFAGAAAGDAVYHTAQIPLQPLAGAAGGGMVVNIHANGPTVYAHELYLLKGAAPGSYQVTIHLYASSDCSGSPLLSLPTAILDTNPVGNGEADALFTPADADGLRGNTLGAIWTVEGSATYASACSVITLD